MLGGMNPYVVLVILFVVIIIASAIGIFLPRVRKFTTRQLHMMIALSAGIFIGILFIMVLPEVIEMVSPPKTAMLWIMSGFLILLLLEVLIRYFHRKNCDNKCHCECECDDVHEHDLASMSAFAGLSIHSAIDGLALGAALAINNELGLVVVAAIAVHKVMDSFSLSSVFALSSANHKTTLIWLGAFIFITPLMMLIGYPLFEAVGTMNVGIPLAIAAGSFMYVGIYDLLREAFHEKKDSLISYGLVIAGIIIMFVLSVFIGSAM